MIMGCKIGKGTKLEGTTRTDALRPSHHLFYQITEAAAAPLVKQEEAADFVLLSLCILHNRPNIGF